MNIHGVKDGVRFKMRLGRNMAAGWCSETPDAGVQSTSHVEVLYKPLKDRREKHICVEDEIITFTTSDVLEITSTSEGLHHKSPRSRNSFVCK